LQSAADGAVFNGKDPLAANAVVLTVGQPSVGVQTTCTAQLQWTDSEGRVTTCDQTVVVSSCDLGCNSTDIKNVLFKLDGGLNNQRSVVERVVRLLRSTLGNAKAGAKDLARAQRLYLEGWTEVWGFPSVVQTCTNAVACVTVSNSDYVGDFTGRADELYSISQRLLRKVRASAHGKARTLRAVQQLEKLGKKFHDASLSEVKGVPPSRSTCG
jgi:hypothetical protein